MAPTKNDNWIRRFEVTDPQRHKNGFTVYKVTSVVFPRSAPEAATKVTVWKRYNDFKKLHNKLKIYCKSFKINEDLPLLSKAKFFKRFEEDVINERTKAALELLNFIGRHQALFTCDAFLHFFDNGYQVSENSHTDNSAEVLENGNCVKLTGDISQPFEENTVFRDKPERDGMLRLGGTWGSRLAPETISVHSASSGDESTLASDTAESMSPVPSISSPCRKAENSLFTDCVNQNSVDIVEDPASAIQDQMTRSVSNVKDKNATEDSTMTKSTSFLPDHFGTVGETVTCHSEKPIKPSEMWLSVRTQDFSSISRSYLAPGLTDSEAWLTPPGTPAGKQDYLVEAAYHVGQAQNYEVSGEYEAAFSFYKAAIACLLSGVHDDEDKTRRRAVREKTTRYLQRAEQIYALHLSSENNQHKRVPPTIADLKTYKVLSIIDKVMLVLNTLDDKCYILKVLEKSPCPIDSKKKTIIPHNVPYMVQLIKYYENENSIFLVLQYASGGRLWDHIENFLQSVPSTPVKTLDGSKTIDEQFAESLFFEKTDKRSTENSDASDKTYYELFRDYTASTAKKLFGYGEMDTTDNIPENAKSEDVSEVSVIETATASETDLLESEVGIESDLLKVEAASESDLLKNEIVSGLIVNSSPMPDLVQTQNAIEETIKELNIDSLQVTDLLENSQRLLASVNKTLLSSESVTNNLNKELKNIETVFDLGQKLEDGVPKTTNEGKSSKKRSSSAMARPKFERRFSSEDVLESRSRTASSSLDRGGQWSRLAAMMEPARPRLSEATIRGWAAELLVALETLHRWGIVCRDLHPENILLGDHGHLLLTFQSHWRGVDSLTSKHAIEDLFAAPETTKVFPITAVADWWSFGALLYHLLTGKPLSSNYPGGILRHTILVFPDYVSPEACSLVTELLRYDPSERLGGGMNGSDDIKSHPFFDNLDWQVIYGVN